MDGEYANYLPEIAPGFPEETARKVQTSYEEAEENFSALLTTSSLDQLVSHKPRTVRRFEHALNKALVVYKGTSGERENGYSREYPHLFLQRILYRINRLKLFWFDDLSNYRNERSAYLREIGERIEGAWQTWELSHLDVGALVRENVRDGLLRRAAVDVAPPASNNGQYFRYNVTETGYRRLLAIASLDGLVEAREISR